MKTEGDFWNSSWKLSEESDENKNKITGKFEDKYEFG